MSAPATSNNMVFDGCGNGTSLNGAAQTFNNMNQLSGTGITYSDKGGLKTWNDWIYSYDAQTRLVGASKGSTSVSFYYDAKNRQVARSINGAITFSVWDDWELIEEYTTGNVRTAAYLQGAHGPVKSLLNNIYFYQDSLGSTSHLASATGALLEYYKYDLNGKPTYWNASNVQITASAYGIRDLFTGERYVTEMGMYDLRNRFYSPDFGRFLQPDPIGFKGDGSNLYRYCGNDWANKTDPLGLQAGHQSSDDKCTNAFNLPDWLLKDMRSQPAGINVALISPNDEGPKFEKSDVRRSSPEYCRLDSPKDSPGHYFGDHKGDKVSEPGLTRGHVYVDDNGKVRPVIDVQYAQSKDYGPRWKAFALQKEQDHISDLDHAMHKDNTYEAARAAYRSGGISELRTKMENVMGGAVKLSKHWDNGGDHTLWLDRANKKPLPYDQ